MSRTRIPEEINNDEIETESITPQVDEVPQITDEDIEQILGEFVGPEGPTSIPASASIDTPLDANDDSDGDTVHTGLENNTDNVAFSDRPVNVFHHRLIIRSGEYLKRRIARPFNRPTHLITVNGNNAESELETIIRDTIIPGSTYGVFIADNALKPIFATIATRLITDNKTKVLIAKTYSKDISLPEEQEEIVTKYHDITHTGIPETEAQLKIQNYWPNMKKIISKIVNNCELCQINKYERNPHVLKFQGPLLAKRPFDTLHIDTFSFNDSKYLTIIDLFSRYAQVYHLRTFNSFSILDKLRHFFAHHNIPRRIVSDEGTEFKNKTYQEFCRLNKIECHYTTVNNPSSNSPIERFHSTLIERLRTVKAKNPKESDPNLVISAVLIYNQSIHSATGHSPFHLLYGPYDRLIEFDKDLTVYEQYNEGRKQELMPFYDDIYNKNKVSAEKTLEKLNENRQDPPDLQGKTVFMSRNRVRKTDPPFQKFQVLNQDKNKVTGLT